MENKGENKKKKAILYREVFVPDFIESYLINGIGKMVYECKLHYLSFGLIAQGIEFLGNCYDEVEWIKEDRAEKRFNNALKKIFKKINKEYDRYSKSDSKHYLYKGLRCGLIHLVRPQEDIALTTRKEAKVDDNRHLVEDSQGKLILVSEDFYDDFKKACKKTIQDIKSKKLTARKLYEPYGKIFEYRDN